MTLEQIFDRVLGVGRADPSGIRLSLDEHPDFYKSIENNYGLRAWLSAGEG